MPSSLIDEEDGVGSWCDHQGDLREVQVHRLGVACGQDRRTGPDARKHTAALANASWATRGAPPTDNAMGCKRL